MLCHTPRAVPCRAVLCRAMPCSLSQSMPCADNGYLSLLWLPLPSLTLPMRVP
jgi:hypothetical protein